jgi:hypothetical protein
MAQQLLQPAAGPPPAGASDSSYPTFASAGAFSAGAAPVAGARPSWEMPWQRGDRAAARRVAAALRAPRTPRGGFTNLDLAKAPK